MHDINKGCECHQKILLWWPPRDFEQFPDTPFPQANGFYRIKWNYLLLSHQRKVVDTAKELKSVQRQIQ